VTYNVEERHLLGVRPPSPGARGPRNL